MLSQSLTTRQKEQKTTTAWGIMLRARKGLEALAELAEKFGVPSVLNLSADALTEEATDILNTPTRHRQNPAVLSTATKHSQNMKAHQRNTISNAVAVVRDVIFSTLPVDTFRAPRLGS